MGIPGSPPDLANLPPGCRFAVRCPSVTPRCTSSAPELLDVHGVLVRCLLYEPGGDDEERAAPTAGGGAVRSAGDDAGGPADRELSGLGTAP
jgi:hypothetical protein